MQYKRKLRIKSPAMPKTIGSMIIAKPVVVSGLVVPVDVSFPGNEDISLPNVTCGSVVTIPVSPTPLVIVGPPDIANPVDSNPEDTPGAVVPVPANPAVPGVGVAPFDIADPVPAFV
jgi:hypothetical protein